MHLAYRGWPSLFHGMSDALINNCFALRASMPQEAVRLAPQAELQALFAEYAIERLFDNPAFLREQCAAEWRLKPLRRQLGTMW
jgi:predicted GNAT family N-acyltransferase